MLQSDQVDLHLYAGPGMSIGYVHDNKKGNTGHIAALSGSISCTADFGRRITLNLGFSTEFGLHLRRDENFDIINLALYKNGLIQSFYPQLSILFRL